MKLTKPAITRCLKWIMRILTAFAVLLAVALIIAWYAFPFPTERLEKWSVSPTVLDVKGRTMLSVVGPDEQWRRPVALDQMSPWLIQATIAVEDERFYRHPGVDPLSVLRAIGQNVVSRRIVSGASTLDMQLCRMMDERPRTFIAKAIESFRALQLNCLKNKDEILELYLNIAPYGGNLRGVEAASLAYFDKHAKDLSLSEAALLAGLPQSPSRYRPDKNLSLAIRRQHMVLSRMLAEKMISEDQLDRAWRIPITICKKSRPRRAPHAAWLALQHRLNGGRTTIDLDIQNLIEKTTQDHLRYLPDKTEAAVVVLDVDQAAIVALVGSGDPSDPVDGQVNGALSIRSPGSALKPFIYATAFQMKRLNCDSTVYDVPVTRGGWTPLNFDRTFSEETTVAEALRRSLNVPAILTAEAIGLARCCGVLQSVGVSLPPEAQRRGGLALAVGGVEVTLLDLTNAYATLARSGIHRPPRLFVDEMSPSTRALTPEVCDSINHILSCRQRRPNTQANYDAEESIWFMWKTGTSSGRRDAWAVGHNHRYAIGVWIGRFKGTGRDTYVGAEAAEPLLATLFQLPALRNEIDPPAPKSILVERPLSLPREVAQRLRITQPNTGDVFACYQGQAVIHATANKSENLMWFVNGRLAERNTTLRLTLSPGRYELRCVDSAGQSATVTYTVLPSAS